MVLPSIAGVTVIEPRIARSLCDAGYAGAIVDPYTLPLVTDPIPFGYEDDRMKFAIQTLRSVLDFASRDPRTNPKKLAAIGLSLGAAPAALLAALEPARLKALVIAAGGGNLPHIFATSASTRVRALRELRMKAHSISSDARYEAELVQALKYDPIHFAPLVKKDNVLMFLSEKDNIIPTEAQMELFSAMGEPSYVTMSSGHVGTLLAVTYLYFDAVIGFLDMRFGNASVFKAPAPQ
jgi:dienelactone hydrolase